MQVFCQKQQYTLKVKEVGQVVYCFYLIKANQPRRPILNNLSPISLYISFWNIFVLQKGPNTKPFPVNHEKLKHAHSREPLNNQWVFENQKTDIKTKAQTSTEASRPRRLRRPPNRYREWYMND